MTQIYNIKENKQLYNNLMSFICITIYFELLNYSLNSLMSMIRFLPSTSRMKDNTGYRVKI